LKRKLVALSINCVLVLCIFTAGAQEDPATLHLSLMQLIVNPNQYDNHRVIVEGFLTLDYENSALYLHADDASHYITKNAVWVSGSPDMKNRRYEINHHYVQIEGVFKASDTGHLGPYNGTVSQIKRIDLSPEHKW